MSRRTWTLCTSAVLAGISIGALLLNGAKGDDKPGIEWKSDLQAAHDEAVAGNRPMLVVFGAEWCRYCGKLDTQTLAHPGVQKLVSESFVPVHLDYDKDREIARTLEVKSLPCTLVLSPNADLLGRLVGFVEAEKYHDSLVAARNLQGRVQQIRHRADD